MGRHRIEWEHNTWEPDANFFTYERLATVMWNSIKLWLCLLGAIKEVLIVATVKLTYSQHFVQLAVDTSRITDAAHGSHEIIKIA